MGLVSTITNVFQVKDLRQKILFTLGMLVVYRVGSWIPIPGVSQDSLRQFFEQQSDAGNESLNKVISTVTMFSGGQLSQSSIFGLGIMPYITAAIIFQLLGGTVPALKKLKEEGPTGYQKIQEWTRYVTVGLCVVQAIGWLTFISRQPNVVPVEYGSNIGWWVMAVTAMTAGTVFLMWLGEQIDRYGIGNGVSLIIMAGILTSMPGAILTVVTNSPLQGVLPSFIVGDGASEPTISWLALLLLIAGFVIVVAGSVVMTVAQRRIPIQQQKHSRGRKVFGGQKSYLPLKINHGGVMPIIFASSLMLFPSILFGTIQASFAAAEGQGGWLGSVAFWLNSQFSPGEYLYVILYIAMVYFFSYFWITVQFNPEEMSKQLRDHGSFIPGIRPGPRTAEYLESVMERVTYVGAGFLAIIAVLPIVVNRAFGIDYLVTQFLGGTGLLIVVAVVLDFLQRVEAGLLMRNYAGFLSGTGDARLKGPRG